MQPRDAPIPVPSFDERNAPWARNAMKPARPAFLHAVGGDVELGSLSRFLRRSAWLALAALAGFFALGFVWGALGVVLRAPQRLP